MGLDIRLPIGLMFLVKAIILIGYGLSTNGSQIYQRSLGININLIWGGVMLVFGVFMIALSRRAVPALDAEEHP